mmetsp:Transcript_6446/g.14238  ORF Transcript_6446/g.14238 Transcript_6446/m.14238 type:complete len:81 (-) Transcript_6446:75-317(-)
MRCYRVVYSRCNNINPICCRPMPRKGEVASHFFFCTVISHDNILTMMTLQLTPHYSLDFEDDCKTHHHARSGTLQKLVRR